MRTKYATITDSQYTTNYSVMTSDTRYGTYIAIAKSFDSQSAAIEYCKKNNYRIVK